MAVARTRDSAPWSHVSGMVRETRGIYLPHLRAAYGARSGVLRSSRRRPLRSRGVSLVWLFLPGLGLAGTGAALAVPHLWTSRHERLLPRLPDIRRVVSRGASELLRRVRVSQRPPPFLGNRGALAMTKHCSRCHRTQPLTAFGNHRARPGGQQSWCRACCRLDQRQRYARQRGYGWIAQQAGGWPPAARGG